MESVDSQTNLSISSVARFENRLPVINSPKDMFADMVDRSPDIGEFVTCLKRPVRIATMCSGTEAPIIALRLISEACVASCGCSLHIEHVFSCEIEPFKQAYILRNFTETLLFRDVRELSRSQAHTAFGALADVPQTQGSVDVLVAGFSCVDFSSLNNNRKRFGRRWRIVADS